MPDIECPRRECHVRIPTRIEFVPEFGPLGQTVMRGREVVSQDDLREHLLTEHKARGGVRPPPPLRVVACRGRGCLNPPTRRITLGNTRGGREMTYCDEHAEKIRALFRYDITADEEIT